MPTPTNPTENSSTYFINPEEAAETARLVDLDHALTKEMGSLFPTSVDPAHIHTVLDLACGPGGWALEVAYAHPRVEVVGVDISQKMIRYAQAQARTQGLDNVSFQIMNILEPLAFPDDAFDFVNARLVSSFVPRDVWPRLFQECLRITQPGGIIRFTEAEWVFSNGVASERFADMVTRAMWLDSKSFSPDGKRFGITLALRRLLSDAGLTNMQQQAFALDYSFGAEEHETLYQNLITAFKLMQPFLVKMKVTTPEEVDQVYQHITEEMQEPEFLGLFFLRSVWGTKHDAT
jgi:SAM-dependent methyltransferase